MFGLETIGRGVVPQGMPQVGLVLGVMFGWAAIRHCRRVKRPALDLSLLKIPTFSQSHPGGHAVPRRRRDLALPGADAAAGRLRQIGVGGRPGLLRHGARRAGDEAAGAAAAAALRLPPGADRGFPGRGGGRRLAGGLHPGLAAGADLRRAGAGRAVPQPAIHRAEHAGLRGCADRAAIGRDQLLRHGAATGPGARRGAGDDLRWR